MLLGKRRKAWTAAKRYFEPDELASAKWTGGELRIADAAFSLDASGRDLAVAAIPDDPWLVEEVGKLNGRDKVWAVAAFLKVRRLNSPDEIIRRARTGELYDENYFTKRGGGGPYVGYPAVSSTEGPEDGRLVIARELRAAGCERVLDLGAATGVMVKALQDLGVEAAGIDISDWAIENRVTDAVVKGTALALPFGSEEFDTVISQDFMEHVHPDDLPTVLREQVRVTRPGARIFHLIPYYDADEPFQLDAHLCQASRDWWRRLFEATPGIEIARLDVGEDAPSFLDRHIELKRL